MASGEVVIEVLRTLPPAANAAAIAVRAGGSTPGERVTLWAFDAGTAEYMDFLCRLGNNYAGGGLTFTVPWSGASATTNATVWRIAVRAIPDDTEDIDASHTYDYNSVTDTVASASGELSYPTITFTNGADMDSWAAGELAIVRVGRDAANGSDTMTGDAELWGFVGRET